MELRHYWDLARRWLWLILLTAVIATIAAYVFSIRQTPIYQASTRLQVLQGSSSNPTVTYADILLSERLSRTYAEVLTARPILEQTVQRIGLNGLTAEQLAKSVTVQPVRDTQLLDFTVEHPIPRIAVEIANTLPKVFMEYNNQQQAERFRDAKQSLERQLEQLNIDVGAVEKALEELGQGTSVEATSRRMLLENRLAQYRNNYSNVLNQLGSIRLSEANAMDTITIVEPAVTPLRPIRPRVLVNTLLAAIVGVMLGLGAAFLIEYLDDTVKTPDDIGRVTGLVTLGVIAKTSSNGGGNEIVTLAQPRSPTAEVFRTIRTGVQFYSVDAPIRSLVITSPGPSEGKSTTAANLAVVMAQAGKKVVLVDADLRKPTQHKRWRIPNTMGLTGALVFAEEAENLDHLLATTEVENLKILSAGQLPPNPSELLGSNKLQQLVDRLLVDNDLIIFDSPPALAVTDAVVLSQAMDGVLLVADAGSTREPALGQTMQEFLKVNAHVIGAVLNKFQQRGKMGYYYYYYYNRYYEDDDLDKLKSDKTQPPRGRKSSPEVSADSLGS